MESTPFRSLPFWTEWKRGRTRGENVFRDHKNESSGPNSRWAGWMRTSRTFRVSVTCQSDLHKPCRAPRSHELCGCWTWPKLSLHFTHSFFDRMKENRSWAKLKFLPRPWWPQWTSLSATRIHQMSVCGSPSLFRLHLSMRLHDTNVVLLSHCGFSVWRTETASLDSRPHLRKRNQKYTGTLVTNLQKGFLLFPWLRRTRHDWLKAGESYRNNQDSLDVTCWPLLAQTLTSGWFKYFLMKYNEE